jgi:hypothetical protein
MAKSFACRKTPTAMAVLADVIDDVRQELCFSERQHGQASMKAEVLRLILACMYYVSKDYEKAESLLVEHNATVKEKPVSNAALIFWGLSKGIDLYPYEPLIESLLQRAAAYRNEDNPLSHQWGFVMALIALSCCITTGSYRTIFGAQVLTRLRFFFRPYRVGKDEWEWIVKHAHLSRNDFVDLLSAFLSHFECVQVQSGTGREPRKSRRL